MITNLVTNYVFNEKFTINIRLDNALDKDYALAMKGILSSYWICLPDTWQKSFCKLTI